MAAAMLRQFFPSMKTNTIIRSHAEVRNNEVLLEGDTLFQDEKGTEVSKFLVNAFKSMDVSYGKFYKMDNLSKLAFLTSEALLSKIPERAENTAIVIANANASMDTDLNYFDTIKDEALYFPSPSLFVYTLPNILMGEISIRNKFKGENAFFIFDEFECQFVCDYVNLLFETNKMDACITGWVEIKGDQYESFLYYIEKGIDSSPNQDKAFIPKNIKR